MSMMRLMMLVRRLVLGAAALSGLLHQVAGQHQQNRTNVTVEYEYKLEVNSTTGADEVVAFEEELKSWLSTIDNDIIPSLQDSLPNGESTSKNEIPNVMFSQASSERINQCYTESDFCQWIRSSIFLSYEGQKPDFSVERVTLRLVQEFLDNFGKETSMVRATYTYPMLVSGAGRFAFGPVNRTMEAVEIEVFESSFISVIASIVSSFDGDTEVKEVDFIYQDVAEEQVVDGNLMSKVLSIDVMYFGICRYCNNSLFVDVVEGVINDPMTLEAFQKRLKYDGVDRNTDYFDDISFSSYSQRTMPDETTNVVDPSIYDSQAPATSNKPPSYVWWGVTLVVLILCIGIYIVHKDQKELTKEEMSTDEEESDDDDDEEETNDRLASEEESDNTDGYTSEKDEGYTEGQLGVHSNDGQAESTVVSYNDEPPTAHGKQSQAYEIYVN
jgi:hypothetical protein